MSNGKYRWEEVLETLDNFYAFFLVGDKEKREEMVKNIENNFEGQIIHLNCETDMIAQINNVFYPELDEEEKHRLESIFLEVPPHIAVDSFLELNNKPVMFIVDEVIPNKNMQAYASEYQMWLRHNRPVYTIMCGTPENILNTMNMQSITFLWRAHRIYTDKETEDKMFQRKKRG